MPVDSPDRFRMEVTFSPGVAHNPFEVIPLKQDHTLPITVRTPLSEGALSQSSPQPPRSSHHALWMATCIAERSHQTTSPPCFDHHALWMATYVAERSPQQPQPPCPLGWPHALQSVHLNHHVLTSMPFWMATYVAERSRLPLRHFASKAKTAPSWGCFNHWRCVCDTLCSIQLPHHSGVCLRRW